MAAVHPHAVAVVLTSTFHDVVGVVCLRDLIFGIYNNLQNGQKNQHGLRATRANDHGKVYLENVVSRFEVGDVDPLAVDVVTVGVPAAHRDALLSKVGTFVPFFNTCAYRLSMTVTLPDAVACERPTAIPVWVCLSPSSHLESSRQKLALWPSATLVPLRSKRS